MSIIIDISNEFSWPQFKKLNEVKDLSEQDKVKRYNQYLEELSVARYNNWYQYQPKGPGGKVVIEEGFLQQEDLFYILQEDGSKIRVTIEI